MANSTKPGRDPFGPPYVSVPCELLRKVNEALLAAGQANDDSMFRFELGKAHGLLEPYFRLGGQTLKGSKP